MELTHRGKPENGWQVSSVVDEVATLNHQLAIVGSFKTMPRVSSGCRVGRCDHERLKMSESSSSVESLSFELALAELQRIVADLEDGRVGLEESLTRFERGVSLLKTCYQTLERAEQKIELLVGMKSDGTPITQPFDATATADQETPTAGRRKSKRTKTEPVTTGDAIDPHEEDAKFLF